MRIYVGNLSFDSTDADLRAAFTPFGEVGSAQVVIDKFSQRSRGFGFVEMGNGTEAQAAIAALNGRDLHGRQLTVNEARERSESRGAQGGGGGGGGFGGGGGGGGRRY